MFSVAEDELLKSLVKKFGQNNWINVSLCMPNRTVRQCKDRWTYYLSPDVNKSEFTNEEDNLLLQKVDLVGQCWTKISKCFNNRTPYAVKNRWQFLQRTFNRCGKDTSIEDIHKLHIPKYKKQPNGNEQQNKQPKRKYTKQAKKEIVIELEKQEQETKIEEQQIEYVQSPQTDTPFIGEQEMFDFFDDN